jgi:hypothetical protein
MKAHPELFDEQESAAINALIQHFEGRRVPLRMESGDLLFVNNRLAVHGKGEQTADAAPGEGRWQRRIATRYSLKNMSEYLINLRVIDPELFLAKLVAQLPQDGQPE